MTDATEAAAPDMLRVLKCLERWFDTGVDDLDDLRPDERALYLRQHRMIRDVIAQAEGRILYVKNGSVR